ncbi:hypothetical protein ASPZODRAFT_152926 [Penicilliopsis zonata CBS 506.65]|uniref:Cyclase n=1 Tax=Penicilliopsis zonata CBS 506.65 TaxID=1073090 RepID=A0A1L9SDQ8_9EURO|nr:hypothetical protein ASPZODRAFT_152926 [Penicilliopsis zonata CBS 506.65]OJJ45224.1 hypothetical protein ASPZODRAFT_152926 [Penicilliopsis zonata CBS 506.65]
MAYVFDSFDTTKAIPGTPQGCLWGFYDRDGKDEVGSINLLTPEVVLAAKEEIKTGRHVQLDWPLNALSHPGFGRKPFAQRVLNLLEKSETCAFDDEIHLNTQSGSQWDSLKHYAGQKDKVFYNGLTYQEALHSTTNGIHNWCERGGIVGRGVLVDMVRFYEERDGAMPSPTSRFEIPVRDIEAAMAAQKTETRQGDILFVRSGFVRWHNGATDAERHQGTKTQNTFIGVQASEESVRWLYERHFAALVGDTVAFEVWPPAEGSSWHLHEWALVWWGTPLGEMWDLEALSVECARQDRYSFFLTSAPLHVKGGVGSPPGAIAIF